MSRVSRVWYDGFDEIYMGWEANVKNFTKFRYLEQESDTKCLDQEMFVRGQSEGKGVETMVYMGKELGAAEMFGWF